MPAAKKAPPKAVKILVKKKLGKAAPPAAAQKKVGNPNLNSKGVIKGPEVLQKTPLPVAELATKPKRGRKPKKEISDPANITGGREVDKYGFRVGSDTSILAAELVKGGKDRGAIVERAKATLPALTSKGNPKPVNTQMSATIKRLVEKGFTIESSWRMVPPKKEATTP